MTLTLAPAFITLTEFNGQPVTFALAHIVTLAPEREATGTAHTPDCPETGDDPDRCACPWWYEETGTRICTIDRPPLVRVVRERHADILTLINTKIGAVIDGARIIARAHAVVDAAAAASAAGKPPL